MKKHGIRLVALTSSWAPAVHSLHQHILTPYFMTIITQEEGFPQKPAPDGILECLRRMKVTPDHAIVVGDSPLGNRAGKAAGTLTVGVLTDMGNRSQLETESPTIIIEELFQISSLQNIK